MKDVSKSKKVVLEIEPSTKNRAALNKAEAELNRLRKLEGDY